MSVHNINLSDGSIRTQDNSSSSGQDTNTGSFSGKIVTVNLPEQTFAEQNKGNSESHINNIDLQSRTVMDLSEDKLAEWFEENKSSEKVIDQEIEAATLRWIDQNKELLLKCGHSNLNNSSIKDGSNDTREFRSLNKPQVSGHNASNSIISLDESDIGGLEWLDSVNEKEEDLKACLGERFTKPPHSNMFNMLRDKANLPIGHISHIVDAIKIFYKTAGCFLISCMCMGVKSKSGSGIRKIDNIVNQSLEDIQKIADLSTIRDLMNIMRDNGLLTLKMASKFDSLTVGIGENKTLLRDNKQLLQWVVKMRFRKGLDPENLDKIQKFLQLEGVRDLTSERLNNLYFKALKNDDFPDRIYTEQELEEKLKEKRESSNQSADVQNYLERELNGLKKQNQYIYENYKKIFEPLQEGFYLKLINKKDIENFLDKIKIFYNKKQNVVFVLFQRKERQLLKIEQFLAMENEHLKKVVNFTTLKIIFGICYACGFPEYELALKLENMTYGPNNIPLKQNNKLLQCINNLFWQRNLTDETLTQIETFINHKQVITEKGRLSDFGKYVKKTQGRSKGIPENLNAMYAEYIEYEQNKQETFNFSSQKRKKDLGEFDNKRQRTK